MGTLIGNLNPDLLGITIVNPSSLLVRSNNKLSPLTKTKNKALAYHYFARFEYMNWKKDRQLKVNVWHESGDWQVSTFHTEF